MFYPAPKNGPPPEKPEPSPLAKLGEMILRAPPKDLVLAATTKLADEGYLDSPPTSSMTPEVEEALQRAADAAGADFDPENPEPFLQDIAHDRIQLPPASPVSEPGGGAPHGEPDDDDLDDYPGTGAGSLPGGGGLVGVE